MFLVHAPQPPVRYFTCSPITPSPLPLPSCVLGSPIHRAQAAAVSSTKQVPSRHRYAHHRLLAADQWAAAAQPWSPSRSWTCLPKSLRGAGKGARALCFLFVIGCATASSDFFTCRHVTLFACSNGALPKTALTSAPQITKLVLELNELTGVPRELLLFTSLTELALGQNKLVSSRPLCPAFYLNLEPEP
jgi:hypothetical protein